MMDLESAIKHCEEVAEKNESEANFGFGNACIDRSSCLECAKEHRQLATWLHELKVFKSREGEWLRMSDELEDDRYKCSHCGNVVHYKDKMDLYTFNKWCGRCGSDNNRK
jgi:hypothetical protein